MPLLGLEVLRREEGLLPQLKQGCPSGHWNHKGVAATFKDKGGSMSLLAFPPTSDFPSVLAPTPSNASHWLNLARSRSNLVRATGKGVRRLTLRPTQDRNLLVELGLYPQMFENVLIFFKGEVS